MHFDAYKKLCNSWRALVLTAIGGKVTAAPIAKSVLKIERYCAGRLTKPTSMTGNTMRCYFPLPNCLEHGQQRSMLSTLTSRADCRISNEC